MYIKVCCLKKIAFW